MTSAHISSDSEATKASAQTPHQLATLFTDRLRSGDLNGLVELYEPDALFASSPETEVTGLEGIREQLTPYISAGAQITLDLRKMVIIGDIALISSNATLTGLFEQPLVTTTTEIARRQQDGRWLYVVDHPFFSH